MSMARRFSLPAVTEASYEPRQIPNAARDMAGTVILRPERQQWLSLLGEMVQAGSSSPLLCTYTRASLCSLALSPPPYAPPAERLHTLRAPHPPRPPQMVNEAVRRRASTVRDASKPLSLEYMADRLDVDDPLTGYLAVRPGLLTLTYSYAPGPAPPNPTPRLATPAPTPGR